MWPEAFPPPQRRCASVSGPVTPVHFPPQARHEERHEGQHYRVPAQDLQTVFSHGLPPRFLMQVLGAGGGRGAGTKRTESYERRRSNLKTDGSGSGFSWASRGTSFLEALLIRPGARQKSPK